MEVEFRAVAAPDEATCARAASLCPTNPFYTPEFVRAQIELGFQPWLLGLFRGEVMLSACTAFSKSGRLNRGLEIVSLPPLTESKLFWQGLLGFCRKNRITELLVNSYASVITEIPILPGERVRKARCEYVIDLQKPGLFESFSKNHLRNIKNATKAGLQVLRTKDPAACAQHVELMQQSLARRSERGEEIEGGPQIHAIAAYITSGAGTLYQVLSEGRVLSSILVLRAERGAYYQSAGTSSEGMKLGASHLLVAKLINALRAEELELFNLGGADPSKLGLVRFKTGFSPRQVPLEAAEYYLGSKLRSRITLAFGLLRHDPARLASYALGRLEKFYIYNAHAEDIPEPGETQGVTFRKLTNEELGNLPAEPEDLAGYRDRFLRHCINEAYGVFCDNKLGHLSWFKTSDQERFSPISYVRLRENEAEITACFTTPEFRGQGLYPLAIRHLCRLARQRNLRRVFMLVKVNNLASQRGIEKAGFTRRSRIVRVVLPLRPDAAGIIYRGHRWSFLQ